MKAKWTPSERERFQDGNRDRATTIPSKRWEGPEADEWEDVTDVTDIVHHNSACGTMVLRAEKEVTDG